MISVSCGSDKENKVSPQNSNKIEGSRDSLPEIKFSRTIYDFGKIFQGEVVGTSFVFTNTGSSSLLVLDASASCGCTVPRWSKEPVPPDGKGSLEVIFDSSGREGKQNKSITVRTNASDQNIVLYITAEVETEK